MQAQRTPKRAGKVCVTGECLFFQVSDSPAWGQRCCFSLPAKSPVHKHWLVEPDSSVPRWWGWDPLIAGAQTVYAWVNFNYTDDKNTIKCMTATTWHPLNGTYECMFIGKGGGAAISYHLPNVTARVGEPAVSVSSPPLTQHLHPMWRHSEKQKWKKKEHTVPKHTVCMRFAIYCPCHGHSGSVSG